MSRKDFANLAQSLGEGFARAELSADQRLTVVSAMTLTLTRTNPRFDRQWFADAVETAFGGGRVPYATV